MTDMILLRPRAWAVLLFKNHHCINERSFRLFYGRFKGYDDLKEQNMTMKSSVKDAGEKVKSAKKKAKKGMSDFQWFVMQVLIFVIIIYVLFAHIIGITTMPNADMYPRIDSGDFLMFYRLDKEPKAQDVVVFEKNGTRYVGRVVAVAGDTVAISNDGAVEINGYNMVETNIFYETYPLEGFTKYPVTLGQGECFILADQRKGTEDSRYFGPVKYSELEGTVITVMRRTNL